MKVRIKNNFFSLVGSSQVYDNQDQLIMKVKGKLFSPTKKKKIYDMNGKLLYVVRNKFFRMFDHHAFITDANGERIAKVTSKYFSVKANYIVEGKDEIEIAGTGFLKPMNIIKNGTVIGTLGGDNTIFTDSYAVEVDEENVNLVIAIVIAIDNIRDRRRNRKS